GRVPADTSAYVRAVAGLFLDLRQGAVFEIVRMFLRIGSLGRWRAGHCRNGQRVATRQAAEKGGNYRKPAGPHQRAAAIGWLNGLRSSILRQSGTQLDQSCGPGTLIMRSGGT